MCYIKRILLCDAVFSSKSEAKNIGAMVLFVDINNGIVLFVSRLNNVGVLGNYAKQVPQKEGPASCRLRGLLFLSWSTFSTLVY